MKKILLPLFLFVILLNATDIKLSGTVMSDDTKMIASRFMGFVKNVYVDEGDYVKKGELLYVIDSKEIDLAKSQVELAISQARLAVQMNQNMYNNAHLNYERYKRLFKKGFVSKYDMEKLKEVLHQYEYLKLKAPNDGVIIQKNIKVGQIAIPGMPALILTSLNDLKIVIQIGESNLKNIHIGQKVDVTIPSIGFKTVGKIASIIPAANPMTHKFKVKISFKKDKTNEIIPGMYAEVKIK